MQALLSVSFGTSHADTRAKTIDAVEKMLRERFPDLAFYSAWTSERIVAKVKAERGERHDTLDEALSRMAEDGVGDLTVSTMCLMRGAETAKTAKAVSEWASGGSRAARMADPLLAEARDRRRVAHVICDEFSDVPEEDALLLMGHGASVESLRKAAARYALPRRTPDANGVYAHVQEELRALGRDRFFVATVEGAPAFGDVWPLVQASGVKRVHLAPLMIVAGDHAKNDLAGDGEDSWASRIRAHGLDANPVLKGLGEYEGIRKLICDHVEEALEVREVAMRG